MSRIARNERSSHWYYPNGDACHTVIAKTSGLPRATNVTDARKLGLVPSVTNILGMKAKPALITWLQDNAILSALNTPRKPGESEADWHSRIADESDRIGSEAADWGTLIHAEIEGFCLTGAFPGTGEILEYVADYARWHRENVIEVIAAEQTVTSTEPGYAGRLDLHAIVMHEGERRRAVIDYKSQKLKGKPKGNFYKEWQMQLMAYADCLREEGERDPLIISILIPSDAPGEVQVKVWGENNDFALAAFRACHKLWCYEKNYTP
jgi:hypothetical protein